MKLISSPELALNLLNQEKTIVKAGDATKRKRTGWDNDYLLTILNIKKLGAIALRIKQNDPTHEKHQTPASSKEVFAESTAGTKTGEDGENVAGVSSRFHPQPVYLLTLTLRSLNFPKGKGGQACG